MTRQPPQAPRGPRLPRSTFLTGSPFLVGALLAQACGPGASVPAPTAPTAPTAPGATPGAGASRAATLRIAILTDEGLLTPYGYKTGYPGLNLLTLVYDTLLQLDAENVPQPLLARAVTAAPDGSSFDVTLRSGLKWHDGRPLTAEDVTFTYEHFVANTHSRFTNPLRNVAAVTASGADALRITLKTPNPSFPVRALADVPILPRHVWEAVDGARVKEFDAKVGSGPYRLVEATPDTVYRMQANPDYFLGAPPVGELIFPVVKDFNTVLQALRAGEVQGTVREVPPEQVPVFSQAPLAVKKGPSFASTLLQLNAERAPLDRKEVRQAIDLAIDKKKLVDTLLLGYGTVATPGFIHPDSPFHDRSVQPRFDPARAKQLLDGAGARPGGDGVRVLDGKPLAFTLLVQANSPLRLRAAELIAGMLKEVGLAVTVRSLDADSLDGQVWPEFDVAKGRDYDMSMWGWSAPVQVDIGRIVELVHSDPRVGTLNIGGYRSAAADRAGDELRTAVDDARRKGAAQAVEQIIAADVPIVMLYFADGNYAYRAPAFDGWVYQKGQGIYTKLSFMPGFGK